MRALAFAVMLAGGVVSAQAVSSEPGGGVIEAPAETTKVLGPMRADARFTVDTDILLAYVNLGVNADLGIVKLGPGVLAVGAGLDVGFCGTVCLLIGGLLNGSYGARNFFPQARLSYHLELPAKSGNALQKVDVYGVVFAGLVVSSMGFAGQYQGVMVSATSTGVGPGVGLGAGGSYFFTERVFVGAEASLKYAAGRYNDVVTVTPPNSNVDFRWRDEYSGWSISGLSVRLFLGFRI
ncbi:MAG: hypothetical protein IAE78_16280 [Myxococcus sp.]|nr:hypothetical protein [Myxococcus sp.]